MTTRAWFLANLWRWACGLPELPASTERRYTFAEARACWFPEFIELMRNRMALGMYRYGDFRDPAQPNYDRVGSALRRLERYRETGNGELLVDVANFVAIEFTKRAHPHFHFRAEDDGEHVEIAPLR